jgi:hypothetical protein
VAGTSTALLISALHQVLTSRMESQLSCIVRESYAQTRTTEVSNSSMGHASPLSENHLFLASILIPGSHHHHGITIAWQKGVGRSTCYGLGSSDVAIARVSFFFVAGPLGRWESYFPLHLPR